MDKYKEWMNEIEQWPVNPISDLSLQLLNLLLDGQTLAFNCKFTIDDSTESEEKNMKPFG